MTAINATTDKTKLHKIPCLCIGNITSIIITAEQNTKENMDIENIFATSLGITYYWRKICTGNWKYVTI